MHGGIGGDGMIGALHWAHERMCSVFLDGEGTETSKTERQNFQSIESTRWLEQTRHNWWTHSGIIREDNIVYLKYGLFTTWVSRGYFDCQTITR